MKRSSIFRRWWRKQDGATALEFAIVAAVFVIVSLGIIEFGRALQVRNEMAYAIDQGARKTFVHPPAYDDMTADQKKTAMREDIQEAIQEAFNLYDKEKLTIQIEETQDDLLVRLSYPLDLFIPGFTGALNIAMPPRKVRFNY